MGDADKFCRSWPIKFHIRKCDVGYRICQFTGLQRPSDTAWYTGEEHLCAQYHVRSVSASGMRFSVTQIDHFIGFITSSHIIQDLPFGERTITLSSRETIKVPNVTKTIVPERIVKAVLCLLR